MEIDAVRQIKDPLYDMLRQEDVAAFNKEKLTLLKAFLISKTIAGLFKAELCLISSIILVKVVLLLELNNP